jgi:hypothetical protein
MKAQLTTSPKNARIKAFAVSEVEVVESWDTRPSLCRNNRAH